MATKKTIKKDDLTPSAEEETQAQLQGGDEIVLSDDDEAALDRAWASPEVIAAVMRDRDRRDAAEAKAAAEKASAKASKAAR